MSYKYQKDILSTLHEDVERRIEDKNYIRKGQQYLADIHRCDTKKMSSELNEVYTKAKEFDGLVPMLKDAIYILQAETPRTDLHLGAIGAYQTILNHINELESEAE